MRYLIPIILALMLALPVAGQDIRKGVESTCQKPHLRVTDSQELSTTGIRVFLSSIGQPSVDICSS